MYNIINKLTWIMVECLKTSFQGHIYFRILIPVMQKKQMLS